VLAVAYRSAALGQRLTPDDESEMTFLGFLVLNDPVKAGVADTIRELGELGVSLKLITGDNRATAERVAAALGIDEVHAEASPPGKVEIVRRLQSKGMRVAFVGDGVNDAPSLAAADVGIAMGLGGTDVAIETAEIALLSDDLSRLPHLVLLSRRAVRTIRQNLAFSLGVLGLAVGLTTIGLLTPVTGALLHELSSLPVIANSARLIGRRDRD
jgi:Cd2+/Zn2+-exporting ATPase